MKKLLLLLFVASFSLANSAQSINHWESIVYAGDTWKYKLGTSDPGATWNQLTFDDSGWSSGAGGFGYGDSDDNTVIAQTPSVFIRKIFNVVDASKISVALLNMDYDDGFVAYINGVEVARGGITGTPPTYNQLAAADHEAQMYSGGAAPEFVISKAVLSGCLTNGNNVLAIEVHNYTANSSDLSAIAYLSVGLSDATVSYKATPAWFKAPLVFTGSNLPIVLIETENNAEIIDEPKLSANMKVIKTATGYNYTSDAATVYDGLIGIEIRGSYSASFPQKSYGVETRNADGTNLNVKILGMPKENDWILLTNYNDKSFARNPLTYHLFRQMGHYAARTRHCEVMINGNYNGVYVFTEKLKQDNDRVDVAKLEADDNAGDSITGGYIFKIDYYSSTDSWTSNYHPIDKPSAVVHFVYHDPTAEDLTADQKLYLQSYVDMFESVLYGSSYNDPVYGYAKYLNVDSFVDYFILGELSRNADAYKKSRYFFKERDSKGGLINSGPVWDFDWAYKNMNDCSIFKATDGSGWAYKINGTCSVSPSPDGWMVKLMQDKTFTALLGNRYHALRKNILSESYLHNYIDSIATISSEAQARHYQKFAILGKNTGAPEVDAIPTTYQGEVDKLKKWIDVRLAWLDKNMPAATSTGGIDGNQVGNEPNIRVFPNPATDFTFVESDKQMHSIGIYSVSGSLVKMIEADAFSRKLDLTGMEKGLYIVRVGLVDKTYWQSKLVIR